MMVLQTGVHLFPTAVLVHEIKCTLEHFVVIVSLASATLEPMAMK